MPLLHPSTSAVWPFAPLKSGRLVMVHSVSISSDSTCTRQSELSKTLWVPQAQKRNNFLTFLLSNFHYVTQSATLSQPFGNNLFICPSNVAFFHPRFPVLIVFGSFILHGNGEAELRVDTFHNSAARLNGVGKWKKNKT